MATRTTPFGAYEGERPQTLLERRDEVLEQLHKLTSSPLFRHSRHYPNLLRYVVEQTLDGKAAHLKERALGIEVFGRDPNYDTNLDPVVRTSACEVRKRIAQYYHEPGRATEIRIDLPTGSYQPEFHFPAPSPQPVAIAGPSAVPSPSRPGKLSRLVPAGIAVAILAACTLLMTERPARSNPVDLFWKPVWHDFDTVLVCVGAREGMAADQSRSDLLDFGDALTIGRLFGIARAYGHPYDARLASSVTLPDLRRGPAILISSFNNPWTMRLRRDMRFTFENDRGHHLSLIRDRDHPGEGAWSVDQGIPEDQLSRDFAIVSRVLDPITEKVVVTVAGLTRYGTIAAGEFVTEERYLSQLAARAPSGWERRNLQVVLASELVGGVSGPPRILTQYVW